jgi:quercetin dioxygenase-like cupin family protein
MVELGYFGNIWVRQNVLEKSGETHGGHKHKFDHITLLCRGRMSVEVDGCPSKEFKAPTFIVIRKEHNHKITALEDGTLYYCVFALRDIDGEVVDAIYGNNHDPLSAAMVDEDYWEKVKQIKNI